MNYCELHQTSYNTGFCPRCDPVASKRIAELEAENKKLTEWNKVLEEDIVLKHQAYKEMNRLFDKQLQQAEVFVSYCSGLDMPENIRKKAQDYFKDK